MAKADIAALLAVAAALMIGIGDVLEQRSAQQVTDKPVGTVALFRRLLRDRRWWAGSLVAGAGFGLQAAALGLGSVVLVQALSVTSLLFALVINAKVNHRRITRWQGIWAALLAAAVAVVVTVGNPQAGNPRGSFRTWAVVAVVMGTALILCAIGARVFDFAYDVVPCLGGGFDHGGYDDGAVRPGAFYVADFAKVYFEGAIGDQFDVVDAEHFLGAEMPGAVAVRDVEYGRANGFPDGSAPAVFEGAVHLRARVGGWSGSQPERVGGFDSREIYRKV